MSDEYRELMGYLDDIHVDTDYVQRLLDAIVASEGEQVRGRLVKIVWKQMVKDPETPWGDGWNSGIDAATDQIKGAYLHTCKVCKQPIGYVQSPGASWWAHETHPEDDHTAEPARLR